MRTFVIGDIHGHYTALIQCLQKAAFDKTQDRLICLGDVCDRGPQVRECIDELLSIKNCVYILGNHDEWTLDWAVNKRIAREWMGQGGAETMASYKGIGMSSQHVHFLSNALLWFADHNRLFLHGGFDVDRGVEATSRDVLLWDRNFLDSAIELHQFSPERRFGGYDEIFVGHTPTTSFGKDTPQRFCNVWAMDTGAGRRGKLTIMDVDTKEYWQSE